MATIFADRVKETSTTTGAGTLTLAGAATGYQSFAAIGNGNKCFYAIVLQGGSEWEVGYGTYTSSGTTLSRDTILASSNSGSAVSFSAGTKDVFVDVPASSLITGQIGGGGIVIPGLSASPDIRVAGASDDEFDTTNASTPSGWTSFGSPTTINANTFAKSHLYIQKAANASLSDFGIYKASPSIPFTVTAKVTDAMLRGRYNCAALFIAEASMAGKVEMVGITEYGTASDPNSVAQVDQHTNITTFGSNVMTAPSTTTPTPTYVVPCYLRIVVTSSTNVAYYISQGGLIWRPLVTARNPGFTIGAVGLLAKSENATYDGAACFDWIRFA